MENLSISLRWLSAKLASICLLVIVLQLSEEAVAASTVQRPVDEPTFLPPKVSGSPGAIPSALKNRSTIRHHTVPLLRTASLSETSQTNSTSHFPSLDTIATSSFAETISLPAPQNFTVLPTAASSSSRSLRGPADEVDGWDGNPGGDAVKEAYEKYMADYNAYINSYYSAYAHQPAAHPLHAAYAVAGAKALPARLPYFQTPPAGVPDFPYVFGYPVLFNGAGMII